MSDVVRRRREWAFAAACALLLIWLLWRDRAADIYHPREQVNIELGLWSTRFLVAALAVTPLSQALREPGLKRIRRPLGLAAVAFTTIHAIQYVFYVQLWPDHMSVLIVRRYLAIGIAALALLLPLAATSTNAAVRWLGPRRWRRLHCLIYFAAPLAVLHELMAWANPFREAGVHTVLLAGLLAWRLLSSVRRQYGKIQASGKKRMAPGSEWVGANPPPAQEQLSVGIDANTPNLRQPADFAKRLPT